MEDDSIQTKFCSVSVEESAVDQVEMEARPQKNWLCNELVCEFCCAIPIVNTWERILLTSTNIHTYLGHRIRKMRLIYRDAIAFIKATLNANKNIEIRVDRVKKEPTVIYQEQWNNRFMLKTNYFQVRIWNLNYASQNTVYISDTGAQLECAHVLYFLRLIAPLLQPIHLDFFLSRKSVEHLKRFLNALSGCIHSIGGLSSGQFNSTAIDEALAKYKKLEIYGLLDAVEVPKLVHWLTNGPSKKYLFLWENRSVNGTPPIQLLDEIKKDFARATSKCRFSVRLEMDDEPFDEFILCNELTGEKLELRRTGVQDGMFIHALSRSPDTEMDNIEGEFESDGMTTIYL